MEILKFKASDQTELFVRYFSAPKERSVALFLAGIESHGGWYEDSLALLQNHGVSTYFLDRRGSGQSSGKRGDIKISERLLKDLEEITDFVSARHPQSPKSLAAISWGAKWAFNYWMTAKTNPYQKLILITPGLFRKVDLPLYKKAGVAFASLLRPDQRFQVPIKTDMFISTAQGRAFIDQDPYRLRQVTARFLCQSFEMDRRIQGLRGIFPQPIYLFQAGCDRIVDNEKTVSFLKEHFFDLRQYFYPKACHTLEFEPEINYKKDLALAFLE